MASLLRFLLDAEAKPLARAGIEAMARPARKAAGRLAWAVGLIVGAVVLFAAAISLGSVAGTAAVLDELPRAIAPLGWAAGVLLAVAIVLVVIAAQLIASLAPKRLMREGSRAWRQVRREQPPAKERMRQAPRNPATAGYAFARGLADGLRRP